LETEYGCGFSSKNLRHLLRFVEVFEDEDTTALKVRVLFMRTIRGSQPSCGLPLLSLGLRFRMLLSSESSHGSMASC
jgi:hypothetical protein